jgi:hypothetical protein
VTQFFRLRSGTRTCRDLTLGLLLLVLLAGCSNEAKADLPSTTTTSAFTRTQVLGWITPTLENGVSLVVSTPTGASAAQLASASQALNTAVSISLRDLAQVSWSGSLSGDERALAKELMRLEVTTSKATGSSNLATLDADVASTQGALQALNRAVNQ